MKNLLASLLSLCILMPLFSQDLIVTTDGDSINCKITKTKGDDIYFTFKYGEDIRSTMLPKSSVAYYQNDYFSVSYVPHDIAALKQEYQRFRISARGGYSYQTARLASSINDDFRDYYKKLKSGYHIGGDISYYFTEQLGAAIRISLFRTTNSIGDIYVEDEFGNRTYGIMSDNLSVLFIGPQLSLRMPDRKKKNALIYKLGAGYMNYHDAKTIVTPFDITGNTVGLSADLGYNIGLTKNLALGFEISMMTGMLTSYELSDGLTTWEAELTEGEYESLSRLDFSVCLIWTMK